MVRALIIANPRARGGRPATIRTVVDALAAAGWSTEAVEAHERSTIRGLATDAVQDGRDIVIAIGGDGTIIEAATPLVGTEVSLGIVPAGTGNLLAGNLRIPLSPAGAARVIVAARTRRVDIGRVDWVDRARHFVVACGTGFDARVISSTHPERKRRWGKIAYFGTAIAMGDRLRNVPHVITIDGERLEIDAAEVIIANLGEIIPNLVRPRLPIVPDDGAFDLIVLRARGPLQGLLGVWETLSHTTSGHHPGGRLFRVRAKEVRVEASPPQPVELDGDLQGETPFTATIIPSAISIIMPRR